MTKALYVVAALWCVIQLSISSSASEQKPLPNGTDVLTPPMSYFTHNGTTKKMNTFDDQEHINKNTVKGKYCSSSANMSRVMSEIMKNSKYDVHTIPAFEDGKALNVSLALTVLVFRDMKEVDMTYTVDFFLRTKWTDRRLRNSLDCVLTMTMGKKHPAEVIWVPDTMIENSVTSSLHEVLTNNHKIDISPNGDVFWSTRVTVKAMCNMNLVKYPRDKQTCTVVLLSYAYPMDLLYYVWDNSNPVGVMDTTLSQFDVTSYFKKSYDVRYVAGVYSILEVGFVFERRLGYYLIQVYIPCIFLVVLAGLSFWVDPKATPARVALSLTTLLTIATIWSAANANMPPVSYVKAIDIYFLTSFGFVLITLLEYIVVLNYKILKEAVKNTLHLSKPVNEDMNEREPYCRHENILKRRSTTLGSPRVSEEDVHELRVLCNGKTDKESNNNHHDEKPAKINENDKKLVSKIDKVTKFIYPLAYIAFNVAYWYELRDK